MPFSPLLRGDVSLVQVSGKTAYLTQAPPLQLCAAALKPAQVADCEPGVVPVNFSRMHCLKRRSRGEVWMEVLLRM